MRLLTFVLGLLWLLLGWWMHSTYMDCCDANLGTASAATAVDNSTALDEELTVIAQKATGPILYDYQSNKAILGDEWDAYKTSVLSGMKGDDKMEITGYYTSDEKAPDGFNNMGEARADEARKALGVTNENAILKGVVSDAKVNKTDKFKGVDFKVIGAKAVSVEETIDDKTIIRFPYNSTNKLSDSAVEDYLDKVAVRVKKSGEKVVLTGHTDSQGREDYNMTLGKKRANIIKNYLTSKGVSSSQITTMSKGESSPIASNSSDAGRAQNRRTELQIIK